MPQKAPRSPEEHQCEEHFRIIHSHTLEGRYIVQLLFKNGLAISISESRSIAVSSFRRLEQCLTRDPINASEYREFLAENTRSYDQSPSIEIVKPEQTYIPHHAVLRDSNALAYEF